MASVRQNRNTVCMLETRLTFLMSGPSIPRGETPLPSFPSAIDVSEGLEPVTMPKAQTPVTPRRSSVARVGVDFFDPAGVEQLRRVLTEKSNHDLRTETSIPSVEHLESKEKQESTSSTSSTITLTGLKVEDGFDFEKTLRYIVRK